MEARRSRPSASVLRERALAQLMRTLDADGAWFHQLVHTPGDTVARVAASVAVGPHDLVRAVSPLDGLPYAELGVDLATAPAVDVFVHQRLPDVPEALRAKVWDPAGMGDALAAMLVSKGEVLGMVTVFRRLGQEPFSAQERQRATDQVRTVSRLLRDADASDHQAPQRCGVYVVDAKGDPLFGPAEGLFGVPLIVRQAAVRFAVSGQVTEELVVGSSHLRLERLVGPRGEAVTATIEPTHRVRTSAAMQLTPLKRRIAVHAAQGATVKDVAEAIGRGEETVKTHLKRIYDLLGVGSRVELAKAVLQPWS